jgi:hypothetical protein
LAASLQAVCQARGLSRSAVIKRAIIELARAEQRKPFGLVAKELGLVGSFSGARDLCERHGRHLRRALRAKTAR